MRKIFTQEDGVFVEMGYEFRGFPANGIWVVKDGSQNCIYEFKDAPKQPTPALVSYMQYSEELMKKISAEWENKALNTRDIAMLACEFFAMKAGAMKIQNEIIEN